MRLKAMEGLSTYRAHRQQRGPGGKRGAARFRSRQHWPQSGLARESPEEYGGSLQFISFALQNGVAVAPAVRAAPAVRYTCYT